MKKSRIKRILESARRYLERGYCTSHLLMTPDYECNKEYLSEVRNKSKLANKFRTKNDCSVCINGALLLASPKYCGYVSRYLNKLARLKGYENSYIFNDYVCDKRRVLRFLDDAIDVIHHDAQFVINDITKRLCIFKLPFFL